MPSNRAFTLPILLISLIVPSLARAEAPESGEIDPQVTLLQAAIGALCQAPEATGEALALALGEFAGPDKTVTQSEDQEIPGRPFRIAIRWIALRDGVELRTRTIHQQNRAVRVPAEIYGHGPKGESWKIGEHLMPLLEDCAELVRHAPTFFALTSHSVGFGPAE